MYFYRMVFLANRVDRRRCIRLFYIISVNAFELESYFIIDEKKRYEKEFEFMSRSVLETKKDFAF